MSELDDFNADSDQAQTRIGAGILNILWRRKALVAFGGVVGLLVGILIYAQRPAVYLSTAQVMVIKKTPNIMPMGNGLQAAALEDYVSSHMVVIRSQKIIEQAVRKRDLQNLVSFAGQDATGAILGTLVAARDAKDSTSGPNNIINLSIKGPVPEDCATVLSAVIESYQDFLNQTYNTESADQVKTYEREQEKVTNELSGLSEKHGKLIEGHEELKRRKDKNTIQFMRYHNCEAKLEELQVKRRTLNGEIRALKDGESSMSLMQFEELHPQVSTVERPKAPQDVQMSRDMKFRTQLDMIDLTSRNGYGAGHPAMIALQNRADATQEYLAKHAPEEDLSRPKAYATSKERYIAHLEFELVKLNNEMAETDKDMAEAGQKVDAMSIYERQDLDMTQSEERLRKRLEQIDIAIRNGISSRDAGGFKAEQLNTPKAGSKASPIIYQFVLGGSLLGLMAGLGLAYLLESMDKGFRTPEEIRRQLGLPVVGHIPLLVPDEDAAARVAGGQLVPDPLLVCHYRPRSVEAEAYRAVRTALYFSVEGEGHKVIQVTSPNQGDGKSTLAGNLAIVIAQSGKKVLLVDADCRRPRQHKVFGLTPSTGLANYLSGTSDLDSCILPTAVEGLAMLPCGPLPPNPAELLTSPRFPALLEELRQRYDFVLVDTPPLLAVTDPCVVAARVDGVLLTISMSRKARPQALRAREILATLGAKILGVVVNRLDRESGAAYQSQSYGGYGYGYSYEYTSSDSQPEMPATGTVIAPATAPDEKI